MKTKKLKKKERGVLYKEIYDIVHNDILSGKYTPGSRIPSADTLAKNYSANRLTVRKALSALVAEGLIYTKPAQGTYVSDNIERAIEESERRKVQLKSGILNVGIVSKVIVTDNIGFYHSELLAGIHKGLIDNKANMTLLPFHPGESESLIFSHLSQSKFDAVIYIGPFEQTKLKTIIQNGPPSVLIDFTIKNLGTDSIVIDNFYGAKSAVDLLISLGHKNIAIVSGSEEQTATKERLNGALAALDEHKVNNKMIKIYKGDFTINSGYKNTAKMLSEKNLPTAIFYMNDEMAHGGINAIKELSNLKIPEDISIIGFDNSAHSLMTIPQLTTISVPTMQMGKFAVERLFARIRNGSDYSPSVTQIETKIILRKTVSAPKKGGV